MARELSSNGSAGNVHSRQRSGTSDPSGASKAPMQQKKAVFGPNGKQGAKKPSLDPIDLKVTVDKLNKVFQDQQRDVAFSVDEEANTTVIKFFNKNTGELIKQYPPTGGGDAMLEAIVNALCNSARPHGMKADEYYLKVATNGIRALEEGWDGDTFSNSLPT